MNRDETISLAYLIGCMELHIKMNIPYTPERMKEALEYIKNANEQPLLTLEEIDLILQQHVS